MAAHAQIKASLFDKQFGEIGSTSVVQCRDEQT